MSLTYYILINLKNSTGENQYSKIPKHIHTSTQLMSGAQFFLTINVQCILIIINFYDINTHNPNKFFFKGEQKKYYIFTK